MSFASDNYSGCLPEVMQFLSESVNRGHEPAYGGDGFTAEAQRLIQEQFGAESCCFFVANGTAANVIALKHFVTPISSVITAESSHLVNHETSAPFGHLGVKMITIKDRAGKICSRGIVEKFEAEKKWGMHSSIPRIVSITQPTEFGVVYSISEIREISRTCKELDMLLHMDGCRLYNAAAALKCSLTETSIASGVDVLSLGGTKNGLMHGEALVFADKTHSGVTPYFVKHMLNMQSKHRFLSAQFIPFFRDSLWLKAANNANEKAHILAQKLESLELATILYPVESNQIFAKMHKDVYKRLNAVRSFYIFEEAEDENVYTVRLVTSFDTSLNDIEIFTKGNQTKN